MTGAAPGGGGVSGFLEFFILEASDYVEQLDAVLLGSGGPSGPDTNAMQRVARALRGTATMAKLPAFAELAAGVERVGRALQQGALRWDPALGGALVAAIDDLKILLRAARAWSPNEDQRAAARAAELSRYAPARAASASTPSPAAPAASPGTFLATEASNIAAGLELLTTRPDADTAANVLRRVRALRGVAGVKEVAPLADALEATEDAARGLESGADEMSPEARRLLEAAAAYLRTLASALRGEGGQVDGDSPARETFNAALDHWNSRASEREVIIPISDLFYGDSTPGLVEASPNPPTSTAQRFRLELVSLGEHLRQVVDAARRAGDPASQTRARRDLKKALRALQAAAMSFGRTEVAAFIGEHLDAADHVDFLGLAALEDLASVLTDPGTEDERLVARLGDIAGKRDLSAAIGMGFGEEQPATVEPPAPAQTAPSRPASPLTIATPAFERPVVEPPVVEATAAPEAPPAPAPTPAPVPAPVAPTSALDSESASLIDSTIAALDALDTHTFARPTPVPEDEIVPIERLLYRGRAALDRAVELRDEMKRVGRRDDDAIEELFDLLELARAE